MKAYCSRDILARSRWQITDVKSTKYPKDVNLMWWTSLRQVEKSPTGHPPLLTSPGRKAAAPWLSPPPRRHRRVGSEMTIVIIKQCEGSLSTAGMKTSRVGRGGRGQRGSLKHLIQRSARSPPSISSSFESPPPLKKDDGRGEGALP